MSTLKHLARRAAGKPFQTDLPPVLVASMGRSGSTLVWKAVRDAFVEERFAGLPKLGHKLVSDQIWDLSKARFLNGTVYKTHGLARDLSEQASAKAIFVFGKASEAAISVLSCKERFGEDWVKEHLIHLSANGPFEEIPDRDVLRFGDQIEDWIERPRLPSLIIRYEALWDQVDEICKFVGAPISFPVRRERKSAQTVPEDVLAKVRQTYAELDRRIEEFPPVMRVGPGA